MLRFGRKQQNYVNQLFFNYKINELKKYPQTTNTGESMERREPSYSVSGNVNWYSHCGEQYGGSLKN